MCEKIIWCDTIHIKKSQIFFYLVSIFMNNPLKVRLHLPSIKSQKSLHFTSHQTNPKILITAFSLTLYCHENRINPDISFT